MIKQPLARRLGSPALAILAAFAVTGHAAENDDLRKKVEELEKTVGDLKRQAAERERGVAPLGRPPGEGESGARRSPVINRSTLNDQQEAAARPRDVLLDPQYKGFFSVPNTPVIIKLNAKPRLDMTTDNKNTGNDKRFVPALFPLAGTPGFGGGRQFNINANGTQLRVDVRAPEVDGNFRFYYQNDFFGSDTANMRFRIQHIYGQYHGFLGGFTYSLWEDPDVWPDTVDYEGPNAVIFARRPVAQYKHVFADHLHVAGGVEAPDFFIDTASSGPLAAKRARMPDLTAHVRYEQDGFGHVQASTIFRELGAVDQLGRQQRDFAWGVNLGASIRVTENNTFQTFLVYGHGVGGMGNDTSFLNTDGTFDAAGNLQAIPYFSFLLGYTHHWSAEFRSTASYGFAWLDPDKTGAATFQYEHSHYASANLVWQIQRRLSVGIEGLYGFREGQGGTDTGDVFRLQLGMVYSIFD